MTGKGRGCILEVHQEREGKPIGMKLMELALAWARTARLVMDREPAMSKDEVELVRAIQQDMPQLS